MPADSTLGLSDVLSGVAIAVSVYTYWRTGRVETRVRRDALKRETFSSRVHAPIEGALSELIATATQHIKPIKRFQGALSDAKRNLSLAGEQVSDKYQKLAELLLRADRSSYTTASDWSQTAEAHWDRFLENLTDSATVVDRAQLLVLIDGAWEALIDIEKSVQQRLDAEFEKQISNH